MSAQGMDRVMHQNLLYGSLASSTLNYHLTAYQMQFVTVFKSRSLKTQNRHLEGYGRRETQPLEPSVKPRGQQNAKCFVASWKLVAAHFYQINAVVAETTQIADTFVAFCLTKKPKFSGKDLPTPICFEVLPTIMIICSRNWS